MHTLTVSTFRKLVSVQSEIAAVELAGGTDMVYRAATGMAQGQLGLQIGRSGSFSGLCVEETATLRCEDSELDLRVNLAVCREVGLRSMVVQPEVFGADAEEVLSLLSASVAGTQADARLYSDKRLRQGA